MCPGLNLFFGGNGQGKTNILEAIFVSCHVRSFRAARNTDFIAFGEDAARIELAVDSDGVTMPVVTQISGKEKRHSLAGKDNASMREIAEVLRVVFFGPEDLTLVKGSPAVRREFLDRAIALHDVDYGRCLKGYQKLLRERNLLLRDFSAGRPPPGGLMETYEEELGRHGARLILRRKAYLEQFAPRASRFVQEHTDSNLNLEVLYDSTVLTDSEDEATLAATLTAGLGEKRRTDMKVGYTTRGPHADDLDIQVNGQPARYYSSQGEQRQVAVAFKLAQLAVWREIYDIAPVLLLDDVASELDDQRVRRLFSVVTGWQVQTLISTTSKPDVLLDGDVKMFVVEKGEIKGVSA